MLHRTKWFLWLAFDNNNLNLHGTLHVYKFICARIFSLLENVFFFKLAKLWNRHLVRYPAINKSWKQSLKIWQSESYMSHGRWWPWWCPDRYRSFRHRKQEAKLHKKNDSLFYLSACIAAPTRWRLDIAVDVNSCTERGHSIIVTPKAKERFKRSPQNTWTN